MKAINLGVAAHIAAAAPGGPRYNKNMSPEERTDIGNGIWLCQKCAKLVDSDVKRFSEETLIVWKRRHEEWARRQNVGMLTVVEASARAPGLLNVSAIYQHSPENGRACILDFRISNHGESDLLLNAVEFEVLESFFIMPLGHAAYSQQYDLDISGLKEYSARAECEVAQILKPGEADRFAIVLSAPSLGLFAGWRLATSFKTNFGTTPGPNVEFWLPHFSMPFAQVIERVAFAAERTMRNDPGNEGRPATEISNVDLDAPGEFSKLMESDHPSGAIVNIRPAKLAGYETFIVVGASITWYYGPQPMVRAP